MRIATKHIKNIDRVFTRAHTYARRMSRDTFLAMIRAYQLQEDPIKELYGMMDIFELQILDAAIAAHLMGYLRSTAMAAQHMAQQEMFSPYETAIEFTKKRLKVSQGQVNILKARYGATAVTLTSQMGEAIERKTKRALQEIIEQNLHVKAGMKHLQRRLKKIINPWALETVVRTQIQVAYGAGRWDANQDPAVREILWGYEYITAGDFRVRPEHEMMEGARFPKDSTQWNRIWPPNGFNCRCEALEIYKNESRAKLKGLPAAKMIKDKWIVPGPDSGWAINHGQIYVSNIFKAKKEIQAIVTKGVERGDVMFITDRFGKTHEVIMKWGKRGEAPTPSNIAKWHREFKVIEKKPAWMKIIDDVVARGKKPNWKAPWWNPKRAEYFEIVSKRVADKKIISIAKPIKIVSKKPIKPIVEKPVIEISEKIKAEINLTGVKESYIEELRRSYAEIKTKFVTDVNGIKLGGIEKFAGKESVMAFFDSFSKVINLNPKFFGVKPAFKVQNSIRMSYKAKFLTSENMGQLIQHEYGHGYFNSLSYQQRMKIKYFYIEHKGQLAKQVSTYGARSSKEMFSEMFVQYANNRASTLTKELFSSLNISGRVGIKPVIKKIGEAAIMQVTKPTMDFIIARKPKWMKIIDGITARGKLPNWKAPWWKSPAKQRYWESLTNKKFKKEFRIAKAEGIKKVRVKKEIIEIKVSKLRRAKTRSEFEKQITQQELLTLRSWESGPGISRIQKGYLKGGTLKGKAKEFQATLDRMPLYKGTVYRGGSIGKRDALHNQLFEKMKKGKILNFKVPASATKDKNVAVEFILDRPKSSKKYLLEIKTKGLPDMHKISPPTFKYEEEVIIGASKKYRVLELKDIKVLDAEYTKILLQEI